MPPAIKSRRSPLLACAVGAALLVACGSRGPLDIGDDFGETPDGGANDAAAADVNAGMDGAQDGASAMDAARDGGRTRDSGPIHLDSGIPIVDCGACVASACGGQLAMCIQDPTCRTTLQCVVQMCGAPNPQCVLQCAGGDVN